MNNCVMVIACMKRLAAWIRLVCTQSMGDGLGVSIPEYGRLEVKLKKSSGSVLSVVAGQFLSLTVSHISIGLLSESF